MTPIIVLNNQAPVSAIEIPFSIAIGKPINIDNTFVVPYSYADIPMPTGSTTLP